MKIKKENGMTLNYVTMGMFTIDDKIIVTFDNYGFVRFPISYFSRTL